MALKLTATHNAAKEAFDKVFTPGGHLEKACEAQSNGTLPAFFAQLLATLGPIVGPMLQAFLLSLLGAPATPTA